MNEKISRQTIWDIIDRSRLIAALFLFATIFLFASIYLYQNDRSTFGVELSEFVFGVMASLLAVLAVYIFSAVVGFNRLRDVKQDERDTKSQKFLDRKLSENSVSIVKKLRESPYVSGEDLVKKHKLGDVVGQSDSVDIVAISFVRTCRHTCYKDLIKRGGKLRVLIMNDHCGEATKMAAVRSASANTDELQKNAINQSKKQFEQLGELAKQYNGSIQVRLANFFPTISVLKAEGIQYSFMQMNYYPFQETDNDRYYQIIDKDLDSKFYQSIEKEFDRMWVHPKTDKLIDSTE